MRNVEGTAGSVANGNLAAIGALLSDVESDMVVGTQIVNELRHVLSVDLGLSLVETRACRQLVGIPICDRPRDTHPLRAHELRERVRCGGSLVRRPKNIDHPPIASSSAKLRTPPACARRTSRSTSLLFNVGRPRGPFGPPDGNMRTMPWLAFAAEIGDVGRFSSPVKLTGYTGLCPRVSPSGEMDRRGPLSKHGPKYLRWGLMEAAIARPRTRSIGSATSAPSAASVVSAARRSRRSSSPES